MSSAGNGGNGLGTNALTCSPLLIVVSYPPVSLRLKARHPLLKKS